MWLTSYPVRLVQALPPQVSLLEIMFVQFELNVSFRRSPPREMPPPGASVRAGLFVVGVGHQMKRHPPGGVSLCNENKQDY